MANYKIGGLVNRECRITVIRNNIALGYKDVSPPTYEIIFEMSSAGNVTAHAEDSYGNTLSYATVLALETTDPTTVTAVGGEELNVVSTSTNYTASSGDLVLVDTTSSDITITLTETSNAKIYVKKVTGSNDVIISTVGYIDSSSTTFQWNELNREYTFACDSTDWYIL